MVGAESTAVTLQRLPERASDAATTPFCPFPSSKGGVRSLPSSSSGVMGPYPFQAAPGGAGAVRGCGSNRVITYRPRRRMARRSPQTYAKREREIAVRERRDRKRAKKAEAAARRSADAAARDGATSSTPPVDETPPADETPPE